MLRTTYTFATELLWQNHAIAATNPVQPPPMTPTRNLLATSTIAPLMVVRVLIVVHPRINIGHSCLQTNNLLIVSFNNFLSVWYEYSN